ncbi:MAG: phospho-N-acetylmuramoyl-pentapeptide-transferase [Clostridiales bacterium]|jgi:phospho-N-acetylmuramoyl-pentapeptide-transferase|nr:phospho-N-acetylmuramoyl-pentapeptide-transferase [Clostridiales bacterium]
MDTDLAPAVYAALGAFALNTILCPIIIPYLRKLKFGQQVRTDGPQTHLAKQGTPTMGGIMILLSFAVAAAFYIGPHSESAALLLVTLAFGAIGLADDYIKVSKKRSLGLRAWQKMLGQLLVTGAFAAYLVWGRQSPGQTSIFIPFTDGKLIDLCWMYIPFLFFVMLGTVNGANFTDGLDGLAAGVTVLIVAFFLIAAWAMGSPILPLSGAAAGSLLGFLLFNSHPAKIFMGDTGSLALGGFVAGAAFILRMPLFIAIVAAVYLIEVLSVILQVGYFKLTHGKRIFKMAPIHHHFEKCGMKETQVVAMFYIVTAILCLIGYLAGRQLI